MGTVITFRTQPYTNQVEDKDWANFAHNYQDASISPIYQILMTAIIAGIQYITWSASTIV